MFLLLRSFRPKCLILVFGVTAALTAQSEKDSIEYPQKSAPNVFIDCGYCDESYIKTEITFVNYVRDPNDAAIHILITQ
jgi:hypothetical protein